MASQKKTQHSVWYFTDSPLGSAVKYIASLSSRFSWVGIYVLKGQALELGPHLGVKPDRLETQSELVVPVKNKRGKNLGQITLESHFKNAFAPQEEEIVRKVAKELGELWPE